MSAPRSFKLEMDRSASWPILVCSRSRPRPGSCTCRWEGKASTSLGFHHRLVRSQGRVGTKGVIFLARWPSTRAVRHARDRMRDLTVRRRLLYPVDCVVTDVNKFVLGWAGYFRYGNSADQFDKISWYARLRLAIFISKRHRRSRGFGWYVVAHASTNQLGLVDLVGTVAAPRPRRARRKRPNAGGNDVGEPCAGEPQARFVGRGLETGGKRYRTAPAPDMGAVDDHGRGRGMGGVGRVMTLRRSGCPRLACGLRKAVSVDEVAAHLCRMTTERTKIHGSFAVDTATTRHLVLDARRAVDCLHHLHDSVCPDLIGSSGRHWVDVAVRSADASWLLLAAAIRRHDATRFLARIELLNGLRLVLDEAPELVRAESRLVFGALDDTEVTLRALRDALSIRGRHRNPAAAARIRQVLAVIAADLDTNALGLPPPLVTRSLPAAIATAEPRPEPDPAAPATDDDADDVADWPDLDGRW